MRSQLGIQQIKFPNGRFFMDPILQSNCILTFPIRELILSPGNPKLDSSSRAWKVRKLNVF